MRIDKRLIEFFLWLGATVLATYYLPKLAQTPVYVLLLYAYFRSKNEALWLSLFLVISDGFWGFFNAYEVVVTLIPGLPPIEIGHLYIALTLVKASNRPSPGPFFHDSFMKALLVYLLFLIFQGYLLGLSPQMNVQFRMIKFVFPLALLYSLPRLFQTEDELRECFRYLFPMAFMALFAQVFTISTGLTPSQALGVYREFWFTVDVSKGKTYRGFYSSGTVLFTIFGALYLLAHHRKTFSNLFLFAVLAANMMSIFLSATRGWLLGMGFSVVLFLIFIMKLSVRRLVGIGATSLILILGLSMIPIVEKQFNNAFERLSTLEKLASGDRTAGGTLERLDKRSPRVLDKWSETPLTGWGFSDTYFHYGDFHVGNQNILLHSGIIGALLMGMFFVFFHVRLILRSMQLPLDHPAKQALLVFAVFFPGWFLIHSSSGQQFGYYSYPGNSIILSFYFTLGALACRLSFNPIPSNSAQALPVAEAQA